MAPRKRASYRVPVNHADAIRTMAKVFKQDAATKSNIEIYNPSRASRFFQHMFSISSRSVTRILNAESGIAEEEEEDEEHHTHVTKDAIDRIRPTIIDMVQKKMPLDLTSLFETLQAHHGWVWGRSTLHVVMERHLGITLRRRHSRYDRLHEDLTNRQRRKDYVLRLKEYKLEKRAIIYVDGMDMWRKWNWPLPLLRSHLYPHPETWVTKNISKVKVWSDGDMEMEPDVPHGKGQRWIILGAGTKDGWLMPTWKMWKGSQAAQAEPYQT